MILRRRQQKRVGEIEVEGLLADEAVVAEAAIRSARRRQLDLAAGARVDTRGPWRGSTAATDTAPWTRDAISARADFHVGLPSSNSLPAAIAMKHALADRVLDRVLDDRRRVRADPVPPDAHVDDLRAVVGRVPDAARHVVVGAADLGAQPNMTVPVAGDAP